MVSQKAKIIVVAIVAAVMTVASLSVVGLLQSTERLGTSGIIIEAAPPAAPPPPPAPSPPPPEPAVEIDVYEDLACTTLISSVSWGEIEAGESSSVIIYVKNNGDISVTLSLDSDNWTPATFQDYSTLSWDYDGTTLSSSEVRGITITLDVDSDCPAINSFDFDIVIIGS